MHEIILSTNNDKEVINTNNGKPTSLNIQGTAEHLLEFAEIFYKNGNQKQLKIIYQELDRRIIKNIQNKRNPSGKCLLAIYYVNKWL